MLGFNVFAADTDEEAHFLRHLDAAGLCQPAHRAGHPACRRQKPATSTRLGPPEQALLDQVLSCSRLARRPRSRQLEAFIARTGADELMITSQSSITRRVCTRLRSRPRFTKVCKGNSRCRRARNESIISLCSY